MEEKIKTIARVSSEISACIFIGSLLLLFNPNMPVYEHSGIKIAVVESMLLFIVSVAVYIGTKRIASLIEGCHGKGNEFIYSRPWTKMFLISFSALFIELMLIRFCSSQIRIFAFYKNIPLIASFLGLGLGCWLGQGRQRHVFLFLLGLIPLAVILAIMPQTGGHLLNFMAAIGSSEHLLGEVVVKQPAWYMAFMGQFVMAIFSIIAFISITFLFVLLGRLLGEAFENLPRLEAYTINIIGSLAGVLFFIGLSYLHTPPWLWFVVGLAPLLAWTTNRRYLMAAIVLSALSVLAVWPSYGMTVWSPYQKLVCHLIPNPSGNSSSSQILLVKISDVFYQVAAEMKPNASDNGEYKLLHYNAIYEQIPRPDNVLVVGSGTGNDVAAALRAGASRVDAVDIDPVIVEMGYLYHPERPYENPRVRVIIDDARAAFRTLPEGSYDAVIFGLLDSHTQLGASSLRLDNYVFTLESFFAAKRLLKPTGYLIVTAATFRDWFKARLAKMIEVTMSSPVHISTYQNWTWTTYIAQNKPSFQSNKPAHASDPEVSQLPSDDWPFLYLKNKNIPVAYIIIVICLAITSVVVLKAGGLEIGRFSSYYTHLFFLGAAFLLMEVHAINRLALLFGTTWLVSAVTIAIVLLMIVLANFTVMVWKKIPYKAAYFALLISLVASFWFQPGDVLGQGLGLALSYGILLLLPVYFAGLIFARSFHVAELAGPAIGANILGSVLGGWVEYATMITGIRALVILAAIFYAISGLMLLAGSRGVKAVLIRILHLKSW